MKGEKTMIMMNEVIANVVLNKVCSIKADKDSDESKQITLKVKFDGATVQSVFDKALAGAVIAWQNGVGRKSYDTLKQGQTVEIQFTAPASRSAVDPETAVIAKLSAMTREEQIAYIKEMEKKVAARHGAFGS
jgi:hypothetical protein